MGGQLLSRPDADHAFAPGAAGSSRLSRRLTAFSRAAAVVVLLTGLAVLAGRAFGWAPATTPAAMKPNTALAVALAGVSLLLSLPGRGDARRSAGRRAAAVAAAVLVALIGALTFSEYVFARDLGIDEIVLTVTGDAAYPARMARHTALALLLLGAALLVIDFDTRLGLRPGQILALPSAAIAFVGGIGYFYDAVVFPVPSYTDMALSTSLTILLAAAGVLAARPDRGLVRILFSPGPAGIMARRLLPVVFLVPVVVGCLVLEGQHRGVYGAEIGAGLLAICTILVLAAVLYGTAHSIETADAARARAERSYREQAAVLQSVFEHMADGVVVADEKGKFLFQNRVAHRLLGEAMDRAPSEWTEAYGVFLPDEKTPFPWTELPLARALRGESSDRVEMFLRNAASPDGVYLSVSGRPLPSVEGGFRGGVAVIHDVTERKHAEREILALNRDLERRVSERTAQLEAVNHELEAFAYSVSHDLRAPLRSIDGFGAILQEDFEEKLGADGKDSIRRMRRATRHMGDLIDDLLKLSKITRAELNLESVDLSALVASVADGLLRSEPREDLELVIAPGVEVRGDPRLLRIALENLIGNAFKFTSQTPKASVEFGVSGNGSRPVYFVRDNGVGFDAAYVGKLFAPFQRLHGAEEFPGTGIGLATVQRVILRHGGTVRAEGAVGKGATFSFTL